MGRVEGKVVAVTGAGAGIGRATAALYAKEGGKVVAISRTKSKLDTLVDEIKAAGGTAIAVQADVSKEADCARAFKAVMDTYGRLDILVTAAGVGYSYEETSPGSMAATHECTLQKWHEVLGINLDGIFLMCREAIPQMIKQGGGAIVNVASIWGTIGAPDAHAYTASKGAIINYTRSLCIAYAKNNIRANTLCPGWVDTAMVQKVMHWFDNPTTAAVACPMMRAGRPEEIAYAALFLGSDEASYCNGSAMFVDGGTLCQ
ncbi:MAG: glucose 1-dehydrogenase [Reyranella sp.]|nr:glucose 1-dehydrogenase [Reyranella sp.]